MASADGAERPAFPLLWDTEPLKWFDMDDSANATLGLDGKGVYLPERWDGPLVSAHRLHLPFPLRSLVSGDLYRHGADGEHADGAALPLLAGSLAKGLLPAPDTGDGPRSLAGAELGFF